jgi:hemerythrin-like domain-containing protein
MASQISAAIENNTQAGHWYRPINDEATKVTPRSVKALHNEHIYMFSLLDSLSEQVGFIVNGKDADFALLLDIIDYMQNFPDRYHHPKEDLIYQRMALRDEAIAAEVAALLDEHRLLIKLSNRLADAIDDVHMMPTVLKKQRVGELCAEYESCLRRHINIEESKILPRALEVLRAEDWFLIEQNSIPINEIPIDNILTDNFIALRRLVLGSTEKALNNLVLAEFLGSQALLDVCGGVGANLAFGQRACKNGAKQGFQAYWKSLKTWLPLPSSVGREFENPLRSGWNGFFEGAALAERPVPHVLQPLLHAAGSYAALIGGRGRAVPANSSSEDAGLTDDAAELVQDLSRILQ